MTTNLDRYAELKSQIAALEAEADELRPGIITHMQEQDADQVEHGKGTFVLQARRTWTYPVEVQESEALVKVQKKEAEQTGSASYVEKPVLVFKPKV